MHSSQFNERRAASLAGKSKRTAPRPGTDDAAHSDRSETQPIWVGAPPPPEGDSFMRDAECHRITGLSRNTRWRLERDGKFPKRRQIGAGTGAGSAIGWLRSEVNAWIASRQEAV